MNNKILNLIEELIKVSFENEKVLGSEVFYICKEIKEEYLKELKGGLKE